MKKHAIFSNLMTTGIIALFICIFSNKLQAQKEIPILAWYSIPAKEATPERYQELKDAGFTITFSELTHFEDAKKTLDLAAQVGIKSIFACKELKTEPEKTVQKIKDHPGLAGYFLRDEPGCADFPELAAWAKRIMKTDDNHFCYLNLFPNYAPEDILGDNYRRHVQRFIEEVGIQLISFDHYPIVKNTLRPEWYENLEIISDESQKAGKPFWAFALATAHDDYPIPDMAQLKLQMYSNLAYGAQGLQYFTYWNPGTERWNFHEAPITLEKKRSSVYDCIREVNKELQNRAFVFIGSHVTSIFHTGDIIPKGTKKLEKLPPHIKTLDTNGNGAVVSFIENGAYQYLVIVNRSFQNPLDLHISFNGQTEIIRKDGSLQNTDKYGSRFRLEAGNAEIFRWKK